MGPNDSERDSVRQRGTLHLGEGVTRILVIDDEPGVLRFVERALRSAGYQVDTASNGPQGLALAGARDYDLVTLDLLLPGLGGMAVLSALLEQDPAMRVLVLSAVGDIGERVRSLDHGAVDFLGKPFAMAELLARVRARIADPPDRSGQRSTEVQVGSVTLDPVRRTVQVDGRQVELSAREYLLLAHLVSHPGVVCSRQELLSEVWGFTFDPGSNVVDVCVARLRAKLVDARIETVRNVGYCYQTA